MDTQSLSHIFLFTLFIGSLLYLLMCVDPHQRGILSRIRQFVYAEIPKQIHQLSLKILGERVTNSFGSLVDWLCYSNHCLVQIFYMMITVGGYLTFYFQGIAKNTPNKRIGDITVIINNVIFFYSLFFYYKVCSVGPGKVTKQNNQECIKQFEYDNIMYYENSQCKTCKITKPALSKHCRVCNMCVLRFDHHCIWVRQCIGLRNYKWFITFLVSHCILCGFTCYTASMILLDYCETQRLFDIQYTMVQTGEVVSASYYIVFKYLLYKQFHSVFIMMMTMILCLALLGFVLYHFYLISIGKTTAEKIRHSSILTFFARKLLALRSNPEYEDEFKKQVEQATGLSKKKQQARRMTEIEECQDVYDRLTLESKKSFIQNLIYVFKQ